MPKDYWDEDIAELLYNLTDARSGTPEERKAIDALVDMVVSEHACSYITFVGSPNPDRPNFGPSETCDNVALPGQERCAQHMGL